MESYSSLIENTIAEVDDFNKRILVVEDDDISYLLIEEILSINNLTSARANCGIEAINYFSKNKEAFDLVLMDVRLPNLNGFEATKQIKEINPSVPIVAVTAYTNAQSVIDCYNSGCDDFIAKPFEIDKFLSTVENYLVCKN